MPDAVRVELRPQALGDEADDVVLEVLGHPRDEGDAHRRTEQQAHAAEEFAGRIFLEAGGILIDDVAEDQRIEQREHLVDGRQDKRQRDQRSVVPEVRIEDLHLSGHYSMPIALAPTAGRFCRRRSSLPSAWFCQTSTDSSSSEAARSLYDLAAHMAMSSETI